MKSFDFDSILFPINFACWNAGNFGPQVFDEAEKRGMGILALKAMALTKLADGEEKIFKNVWYRPIKDENVMKMALKYSLSKNITAAVPPGKNTLFLKALEFMNDYQPITEQETQKLLALAKVTQPVFMHS
jgi:predicted aldo/keto reductase-like oxidoreductase